MVNLIACQAATLAPLAPEVGMLPVLNRRLDELLYERLADLPGEVSWSMDFWPAGELLQALQRCAGNWRVRAACGRVLAESLAHAEPAFAEFPADGLVIRYPWHILELNERLVAGLEADFIEGEIRPGVSIDGHILLGKGSVILPGVYIEGNVVVGRDSKIGPNCYIRGNTVIGDRCHIGQAVEVKNSVLMNKVSAGHLSYIGDSVVADNVNFGAGTIISNFRHDGANHRTMVDGVLVDTGRRKFGSIIGEGVHTGIHSAIYPGRKIWPHVSTLPGEVVQVDKHA